MNRPYMIEIRRTVDDENTVRYWVGSLAVMKDPEGRWGVYPDGTLAQRPLFTADTLELIFERVQGAVALMQPAEEEIDEDPYTSSRFA